MKHSRSAGFLIALLAVVGLRGCASVDLEDARRFQEAQAVFESAQSPEDYLRAAAIYDQILASGVVSGAVLYNQGNAYMRAGETGRAIAAYRQAKRYRPRDPYLEANLRGALGLSPSQRPERSLAELLLFWQDWISYRAKFQLLGLAALATFCAALAARLLMRRWARVLALVFLLMTGVAAISAGYDWFRFERIQHGVVVEPEVVARKGNGTSYQPAFTEPLGEGAEFMVVERRGRWLLVRLAGNQEGWVPDTSVVTY